ncbi:MAG: alpha/beta hydrolase [Pseudomonadota bacterium]
MIIALRFLSVVVLSLMVIGAWFYYVRLDFIYVFDESPARPAGMPRTELRQIPAFGDDPPLSVWLTEPEAGQPVVLYFMGEAGTLSVDEPRLRRMAEAGFGIAAMAYRGGGGQPGKPSEATLYRDALRLFAGLDRLYGRTVPDTDRVIYGYSLGAGLATRLAAEQEELALILEAPFTDFCAVKTGVIAIWPGCVLYAGQEYDIRSWIPAAGAPVLILHGNIDERVPLRQGRAVFAAARAPKFMEVYTGGGHDNLARFGAIEDAIGFVKTLRGER